MISDWECPTDLMIPSMLFLFYFLFHHTRLSYLFPFLVIFFLLHLYQLHNLPILPPSTFVHLLTFLVLFVMVSFSLILVISNISFSPGLSHNSISSVKVTPNL